MTHRIDPPPLSLPIYDRGGTITTDWHRWFSDIAAHLGAIETAGPASDSGAAVISVALDAGDATGEVGPHPLLDLGGSDQ